MEGNVLIIVMWSRKAKYVVSPSTMAHFLSGETSFLKIILLNSASCSCTISRMIILFWGLFGVLAVGGGCSLGVGSFDSPYFPMLL
jgi:hypothetical protein